MENGNLMFSTYLGGISSDEIISMKIDDSGDIFLAGNTLSPDFPTFNSNNAIYVKTTQFTIS